MGKTVRLRHIDPHGDMEYPVLGRIGDDYVKAGEELDVDVEVAGREPGTWREPTDAERAEGIVGLERREVGEAPNVRLEVLDPGHGLLGQGHFERVKRARTTEGD